MRILIDMDGVLYNLHDPWYAMHNKDYPNKPMKHEDVKSWDMHLHCAGGKKIYSYLDETSVWETGGFVDRYAFEVTERWVSLGFEVGIVTTIFNGISVVPKWNWVKKNLPHIKDIHFVTGNTKHWLRGDVIIDDAIHNLDKAEGVRILYNQPWNASDTKLVRALDWMDVEQYVNTAHKLLSHGYTYNEVEITLRTKRHGNTRTISV